MAQPEFPSPHPTPITEVSPSLANNLLACELRVAFTRDPNFKAWRRPNTYTSLGQAAHAVTEAAFKGADWDEDPAKARNQIEALWDKEVTRSAAALVAAWAPAVPPPSNLWPGYQLTRARTIRRAARLLASRTTPKQEHQPGTGVEVDLKDPESGLFGRADRIERHGSSIRVIDLKTGLRQSELTEDQQRQLLLYAVLINRMSGEWPSEIAIEDASGGQTAMPLDAAAAEAALSEVIAAVSAFNDHIAHGDVEGSAEPTIDRCRGCAFRVACAPYWRELRSNWEHRSVRGELIETGNSEQGGFAQLRLDSPVDRGGNVVHISALPTAPEVGSHRMAAVDLTGVPGSAELRARWSTTIRTW